VAWLSNSTQSKTKWLKDPGSLLEEDDFSTAQKSMRTEVNNKTSALRSRSLPIPGEGDDRNWLERKLNTPQDTGLLGDVLDVISRGQYASANVAKTLTDGKDDSIGDVASSVYRGLSGEDKTSYGDVLEQSGMERGKLRSALGFVADVALDPTTYLTLGVGTGAKVGGKAAAKGLGKVIPKALGKEAIDRGGVKFMGASLIPGNVIKSGVEKIGLNKAGNLLRDSKPVQVLGKSLVPNFREAGTDKAAWDAFVDTKKGYQNSLSYAQNKAVGDAVEMAKGFTKEERTLATHAIQNPVVYRLAGPKVKELADTARKSFDDSATVEQGLGLLKEPRKNYVPGIYPDKKKPFLQGIISNPGIKASIGSFGKQKKFDTLKDAMDAGLSPETDIAKLSGSRQVVSARATETQKFINEALEKFGTKVDSKNIDKLSDDVGVYLPKGSLSFFSQKVIGGNVDKFTQVGRAKESVKGIDSDISSIQKQLDGIVKSIATGLKDADRSVAPDLLHNKIKALGGIAPSRTGAMVSEYAQSIPKSLKRKNGRPIDEVADELGITARELLDGIASGIPKPKNYMAEAERIAVNDSSYKALSQTLDAIVSGKDDTAEQIAELLKGANKDELIEIPSSMIKDGIGVSKNVPAYALPKQIANELNNFKALQSDEGSKGILGAYDNVLNLWKGYATAVNPGFHIRNAQSNAFQTALNSGKELLNPMNHVRALGVNATDLPFVGKKIADKTIDVGGKEMTLAETKELMKKEGVIGSGWFGADIPGYIEKKLNAGIKGNLSPQLLNPLSQNNALIKAGRTVGTGVENQARAFNFLSELKKTGDVKQAAKTVNKTLFDYGDVTPFEKNVLKRTVPFYTWLRKNVPLQTENLIRTPGKYAATQKALNGVRNLSEPVDEKNIPDYMDNPNWVKTPLEQGGNPMYWNANLPIGDLEKLNPAQIGKTALSSLSPLLKAPLELGFNQNTFFGDKIEKYPGEMKKAPGYVPDLPDTVVKLLGAQYGVSKEGVDELQVPADVRYMMSQVPFMENVSKSLDLKGDKKFNQLLTFLMGAKITPFDAKKAEMNALYDQRDALRAAYDKYQTQGLLESDEELAKAKKKKKGTSWLK